jgi:mRNA-degrading endonuclease RelE of RelBE toxin-antitoxin system
MPVRSYRLLYKIEGITSLEPEPPDNIPDLPGTTPGKVTKPIYCLMKRSIGDFLGIVPLDWDAEELTGTYQGNGGNKGSKYRKRVGGFRVAAYTLVAIDRFTLNEYVPQEDGSISVIPGKFRTISIGFPIGHSVNEFVAFLKTTGVVGQVAAIRTPNGRTIGVSVGTITPVAP